MGKKNRKRELTVEEQMQLILNDTIILPEEKEEIEFNENIAKVYAKYADGFSSEDDSTMYIPLEDISDEHYMGIDNNSNNSYIDEHSVARIISPIKMIRLPNGSRGIKMMNYTNESVIIPVQILSHIPHDEDYDTMEVGLNLAISMICKVFTPAYILPISELKSELPKYKVLNNIVFTKITEEYAGVHILTDTLNNIWDNFEDYSDPSVTLYGVISNMLSIGINTHTHILDSDTRIDSIEDFISNMNYELSDVDNNEHGLDLLDISPSDMLSAIYTKMDIAIEDNSFRCDDENEEEDDYDEYEDEEDDEEEIEIYEDQSQFAEIIETFEPAEFIPSEVEREDNITIQSTEPVRFLPTDEEIDEMYKRTKIVEMDCDTMDSLTLDIDSSMIYPKL